MVIGERFVWAHLPKTGGDATAAMFAAVPGLVRFADAPESPDKHLPFFGRESELDGRLLVMNIRRLPAWTVSAAHHAAKHGVEPDYVPIPLPSADQLTSSGDPDGLLRWMTDQGRIEVNRWLRTESLEEDLLALLDELGALTADVLERVRAVGRANVGSYASDEIAFSDAQVRRLYELNPMWAAIERRVYAGPTD